MFIVATENRKGFQKERQSKVDKGGGERGIEIAQRRQRKILKTSRRLFEKHNKEKRKA
jgi:hypothetical protein